MANDLYSAPANQVFKALSDPTRRQVLEALGAGELAAGEIASRFPISGPSVSRHLSVLRAAGLVSERRQANRLIYSLVADRVAEPVTAWLRAVCPDELAALSFPLAPEIVEKINKRKPGKTGGKRKRRSTGKPPELVAGQPEPSEASRGTEAGHKGTEPKSTTPAGELGRLVTTAWQPQRARGHKRVWRAEEAPGPVATD